MKYASLRAAQISYAMALLVITIWFIADFPILRLPIAAAFTLYAVCLWRWPGLWLVAVPALLPVFDLAPWSGRFFFDEFDALVLLTAGVLALRENGTQPPPPIPRGLKSVLALLAVSYLLSTLIQVWPPPPITPDSFANYYSPYNSLRVSKGFVWALLLCNPLRRAIAQDSNATFKLMIGLLLGLFGVGAASVYERQVFSGLFAWTDGYRISATFSSMHTGDGPIDVWLAVTIPLLGVLFLNRRWLALLPVTIGLGLLSFYTLFATGSRGPLIAIVIAYAAGLLGLLAARLSWRRTAITAALGLGAFALIFSLSLPILSQTATGKRFAQVEHDAAARLNHWRNSLSLRDDTATATILGMGLGSFPRLYNEAAAGATGSSLYNFMRDGANGFIRMWSGHLLYMGQAITIDANSNYKVSVRVRTSEPNARLNIALCDIWVISSYNCVQHSFQLQGATGKWQTMSGKIRTGVIGYGGSAAGYTLPRPTRMSFWIGNAPLHGVDIDAINLTDENGIDLVANGEFNRFADHWFWITDNHRLMHTLNLVVGLLIDQGWLGLLAAGSLLVLTLMALARQIAEGDSYSAVLLAAMSGFMVTGVTVSTFDQPRLVLMFYILCLAILFRPKNPIRGTL